jgi:hypothetical protein
LILAREGHFHNVGSSRIARSIGLLGGPFDQNNTADDTTIPLSDRSLGMYVADLESHHTNRKLHRRMFRWGIMRCGDRLMRTDGDLAA